MNIDMNNKSHSICVLGLGYVGLPLAVSFAEAGYTVYGLDVNEKRLAELKNNIDRTEEITSVRLEKVSQKIHYVSAIKTGACGIYIVTVPTPVDINNEPNLQPLEKASKMIGETLKRGDLVIYESTVYPGVTEDFCVPILEKESNLTFNEDFFIGYSPERMNPGDKERSLEKITKVTSGSTPETAQIVDDLYRKIIKAGTVKASSIKVAETAKVIENTQRDVNIALMNELAMICHQMNVDVSEVIDAAASKWNFMKFTPGLVGGHCIGVDPYYLTFKAQNLGYQPNLILAARQINSRMGKYIAEKTIQEMIKAGHAIKGSKCLIMGLTFKENCPDLRNSRVFDIIQTMQEYGVDVVAYDPWVDFTEEQLNLNYTQDPLQEKQKYHSVIVAVGHDVFKGYSDKDYEKISLQNPIVIDVKNIVANPTWRL